MYSGAAIHIFKKHHFEVKEKNNKKKHAYAPLSISTIFNEFSCEYFFFVPSWFFSRFVMPLE